MFLGLLSGRPPEMLVFIPTLLTGSLEVPSDSEDLSSIIVTSDVDGNEIAPSTVAVACEDEACSSSFSSLLGL